MFKWITTAIFAGFLGTVYVTSPKTLINSFTTKEEAAVELAKIKPIEALPLVLFDTIVNKDTTEPIHILQNPEGVIKAVIVEGKMIKGTLFFFPTSEKQRFFCPKENSDEVCFAPVEFENGQRLQCVKEPTPVVKESINTGQCGVDTKSVPHTVLYEICPSEMYTTREIPLYEFCYDNEKQKTSFTIHSIMSPMLLQSKLLYREQRVSYSYPTKDEVFKTANYKAIKNSMKSASNSSIIAKRPMYQVQKLVPNGDMALALWKKSLYQFFNVELLHKTLFSLWSIIDGLITLNAIRMYNEVVAYEFRTGVFDVTTTSEDDDQIYNMWVKIIRSKPEDKSLGSQAVVILMNNFIGSSNDDSEPLKSKQMKIESYCEDNLCKNNLLKLFIEVKGRVRCCPLTAKIGALFGMKHIEVPLPVLQIPHLISNSN